MRQQTLSKPRRLVMGMGTILTTVLIVSVAIMGVIIAISPFLSIGWKPILNVYRLKTASDYFKGREEAIWTLAKVCLSIFIVVMTIKERDFRRFLIGSTLGSWGGQIGLSAFLLPPFWWCCKKIGHIGPIYTIGEWMNANWPFSWLKKFLRAWLWGFTYEIVLQIGFQVEKPVDLWAKKNLGRVLLKGLIYMGIALLALYLVTVIE